MKKVALVVFIVGILALALMLEFKAMEIKNVEDLDKLENNRKVSLIGKVASERYLSGGRKIFVVNGIDIVLDGEVSENFLNKEVEVLGVVSDYNEKKQIEVLRLKSLN